MREGGGGGALEGDGRIWSRVQVCLYVCVCARAHTHARAAAQALHTHLALCCACVQTATQSLRPQWQGKQRRVTLIETEALQRVQVCVQTERSWGRTGARARARACHARRRTRRRR